MKSTRSIKLTGNPALLGAYFIIALINVLAVGISTYYYGNVLDLIMANQKSVRTILWMIACYVLLQFLVIVFNQTYTIGSCSIEKRMTDRICQMVTKNTYLHGGDKTEKLREKYRSMMIQDIQNYVSWSTKNEGRMIRLGIREVVFLAILCSYSWLIAILIAGEFLIYIGIRHILSKRLESETGEYIQKREAYASKYKKLENQRLDFLNAKKSYLIKQEVESTNDMMEHGRVCFEIFRAKDYFENQLAKIVITISCLTLEIILCLMGKISVGQIAVSIEIISYLEGDLDMAIGVLQEYNMAKPIGQKILSVLQEKSDRISLTERFQHIELKRICFDYDTTNGLLKDCNVEFKSGKSYAIIGESGSGKSTLVKIILGELEPDSGEVYYNDILLEKEKTFDLYDVAYMSQAFHLFNDTIKNNICFGDEKRWLNVKDNSFWKLLTDYFTDFEQNIEGSGNNISGGQRQIIAIARAIAGGKTCFLFDESFSALDEKHFYEIEKYFLSNNNYTKIFITHRYNHINKYDYVLKKDEKGGFSSVDSASLSGAL